MKIQLLWFFFIFLNDEILQINNTFGIEELIANT